MNPLPILLIYVGAVLANEAAEEFVNSNNHFASSIYQQISKSANGNFVVSPFSAEVVLTLTHAGSRGPSAEELRAALHLSNDSRRIEQGVKYHVSNVKSGRYHTLDLANKIYVKNSHDVNPKFRKLANDFFGADVESIDFARSVKAAKVINSWAEKNTHGRIRDVVDPDVLDDGTHALVVNLVFFRANWSVPFHVAYTRKGKFYKTPTEMVDMLAMHNVHGRPFLFCECQHLKAKFLELPFEGGIASMTFVLPNEIDGLHWLERHINEVIAPHNLTSRLVQVELPKFKIDSFINMETILKKLGVNSIFEHSAADLSGIAGAPGDLVVSRVIQRTFVDVNEEGASATAATFAIVPVSTSGSPGKPAEFIANHPFIFFIRVKGAVIFVGRVTDPSNKI